MHSKERHFLIGMAAQLKQRLHKVCAQGVASAFGLVLCFGGGVLQQHSAQFGQAIGANWQRYCCAFGCAGGYQSVANIDFVAVRMAVDGGGAGHLSHPQQFANLGNRPRQPTIDAQRAQRAIFAAGPNS